MSSTKAPPIALNKWLAEIGVNPITAWRWRKLGWLETINICGRVYITQAAAEKFKRRAEAGEFAQVHKFPERKPRKAKGGHS